MALLRACSFNNEDDALEILNSDKEFDINEQDHNGHTVLMHTCINNMKSIIPLILKNPNININLQCNEYKLTAPMYACQNELEDIIIDMIRSFNIDTSLCDNEKNTLLHIACIYQLDNIVVELLDKTDADINAQNEYGFTPAMILCKNNSKELEKIIDKRNINIILKNYKNKSVLDYARKYVSCDTSSLLNHQ